MGPTERRALLCKMIPVITIDGPTASGKGTVAARVARALGFHYLDSGALYRLCAYKALKEKIDLTDESALAQTAAHLAPLFEDGKIYLDREDVTDKIRAEEVGVAASKVASLPAVKPEGSVSLSYIRSPRHAKKTASISGNGSKTFCLV